MYRSDDEMSDALDRRSPRRLLALVCLVSAACARSVTATASGDAATASDDAGSVPGDRDMTGPDATNVDASAPDGSRLDATMSGERPTPDVAPSPDVATSDTSSSPDAATPRSDSAVGAWDGSHTPPDVPTGPTACGSALRLRGGDGYLTSSLDVTERLPGCTNAALEGGAVRWFSLAPGASELQVIVFGMSDAAQGSPVIRVYDDCPPTACVQESVNPHGLSVVQVRLAPRSGTRDLAVGSDQPVALPPPRTFQYGVVARELTIAVPDNGRCAAATRVHDGTDLLDVSLFDAQEPASWCDGGGAAPALFYAVRVGGGETMRVEAIHGTGVPTTSPAPTVLFLSSGCAPTTCLASGMATGVPGQTRLEWRNAAAEAREVILAVAKADPRSIPFRFDLAVRVGTVP